MRIQTKELEGRDHLVVPTVMIVEGVLNGSKGPIFYPADSLKHSAPAWNGRPVVVYHPDMDISPFASHPEIFNKQKVGVLFNVRYANRALKAEAWLDVERLRRVDPRVLRAVERGKMMEVSTGLTFPLIEEKGIHNGRDYWSVARHLQPDHLAILPDRKGACSIADGAGLLRNQRKTEPALCMPCMNWNSN